MLLLDTSRFCPSLFLSHGESLFHASPDSDSFLLPRIADLLQEHSLTLENLSVLAIGTGPGRFAGTRSGVALFTSLSFAAKLPLLSFPSPLLYLPPIEGPFLFVTAHKSGSLVGISGRVEGGFLLEYSSPEPLSKEELSGKLLVSDTPHLLPLEALPLGSPNPEALLPLLKKKLSLGQTCSGPPEVSYGFTPA